MTKRTGLAHALYVDGVDLSGDINSVGTIGGGNTPIDQTAINQTAFDRTGGIRDGRMEITSYFNSVLSGSAHASLSALPGTNRTLSYCAGTTLGDPVACLVAKQATYDTTRPQDGSLLAVTSALGSGNGLEWQEQLTAGKMTQGSAAAVTGVDFAAATAFGLQAFLHVFAFTGTSATIKLQESSDNGAGDAYADVTGAAFTVVSTAPQAQRIQTTRTLAVERYLRVITTGTFSNLVFAVSVAKNATAVVF
jgi:hypothetical protein